MTMHARRYTICALICAVDDHLRPLLEAAEANALPTDKPIMSDTVSEDIINSAEYITSAEYMAKVHEIGTSRV